MAAATASTCRTWTSSTNAIVWQQPCAFEQSRRGDCEDFALWAWRKLVEMGVDAEFYVGRVMCGDDPVSARQHAWVVYRVDDEFLFEPRPRERGQR